MDLLFMLIPAKYQPVIVLVAIVGFFGSELLSMIPWFKSNGWCQAIANIFRAIVKKFRPELIPAEPVTIEVEATDEKGPVSEPGRIVTPELTDEQRDSLNSN